MPQLPQVQTVRRFLSLALPSLRIKSINLYYPGIIKQIQPSLFISRLLNQSFVSVDRYGKYLILKLTKNSILSHLRMQGKYCFYKEKPLIAKHDHVEFVLDKGYLVYSDVRKFGTMVLVDKGKQLQHKSISKLGPEINNDTQFDVQYMQALVSKKKGAIKAILLDQQSICGAGNIYVDEILFSSQVHPQKDISKLNLQQVKNIVKYGKLIIDNAILNNGTTFRSFSSNHEAGTNQNNLNAYGKVGEKCSRCKKSTIKKIKVAGRGTYFCPTCQINH